MAEFLNTEKSYAALVDLINKADRKLVLISPYIKVPERLLERLKDACRRGSVEMTLVCRKEDLKPDTKSALAQIPRLTLRFLGNLHAKCFYNDSAMIITSLNLHEHSQQNNREMGIYLTKQDDGDVFLEALEEAEFIVRLAEPEVAEVKKEAGPKPKFFGKSRDTGNGNPTLSKPLLKKGKPAGIQSGHCIRCGKDIPYNIEAPYCASCYSTWKRYKDPDYEEEYCHWCGKPNELTTIERPLCRHEVKASEAVFWRGLVDTSDRVLKKTVARWNHCLNELTGFYDGCIQKYGYYDPRWAYAIIETYGFKTGITDVSDSECVIANLNQELRVARPVSERQQRGLKKVCHHVWGARERGRIICERCGAVFRPRRPLLPCTHYYLNGVCKWCGARDPAALQQGEYDN